MSDLNHLLLGAVALLLLSCGSIKKGWVAPQAIPETIDVPQNGYLAFPDQRFDVGEEDFTVAVWIRTRSKATQMIAQKGGLSGAQDPQYWLRINDFMGGVTFLTGDGTPPSSYVASVTQVADGTWHHLVAQRKKKRLRIFIDGELDAVSDDFHDRENCSNPQSLKLGIQKYQEDINLFQGQLHGFRLYLRPLKNGEVRKLMEATRPS